MTAQFKGQGMLNGTGNYHFWVWVTDSDIDTFRIKIWDENGDLFYATFITLPAGMRLRMRCVVKFCVTSLPSATSSR